ncbi:hypothetical protein [Occallatibacter riparius]|uniref:Uncharacterized protein n=1 Tax=Occallatibacter riparius TaxID=1002689 RepID=A0A9J7BPG7_9BACT|nr:hypothetical protein [Occallatibacter riparius]UWZ84651.1 hypothetical protein MOP44_01650 [Occallatibacter riparius]
MTKLRRYLFVAMLAVLAPLGAIAADVWHEGYIEYPHTLAAAVHGVVPEGTRITLDDGTAIELATLDPGDVFQKLIAYWSKERTDYRAAPPNVDKFLFKVRTGKPAANGGRYVEIRYSANDWYGRSWKGVTHAIK